MADPIRFNIFVTVKEGRLDDFKGIAKQWSTYNYKQRPDILSYEWFFLGDDEKQALVMELYESSEAMLATMEQVSESEEAEEPDYPYDMVKMQVCGKLTDALRKRLDAGKSKIEYYNYIDGFTREPT
jgi:hypothetical protein